MRTIAILLFGIALTGCKGAADRVLGGTKCDTRNEDPAFCYRVPAGMKPKGEAIRRAGHFQIGYQGDAGTKVAFLARDLDTFDSTWKSLQSNAKRSKATDAKEEEIDGGSTRILRYSTPGKEPRFILSMLRKGPKLLLECEAEAPKSETVDDLLAACKDMHEP